MFITAKTSIDLKYALNLFKTNLGKARVVKKDGRTVMLISGNKHIGTIIVQRDKASIINIDNMSFTCIKAYQPKTYSAVGNIFKQILAKFEFNNPLLANDID